MKENKFFLSTALALVMTASLPVEDATETVKKYI